MADSYKIKNKFKDLKYLNHIALIMDGNGRWAKQKKLNRLEGHKKGAEKVIEIVRAAQKLNLKYLTFYAFSTENWKRSPKEINGLMNLLGDFIDNNAEEIRERDIRLRTIGEIDRIPIQQRKKLLKIIDETKDNKSGNLIFALSYGGRQEIIDAAKKIGEKVKNNEVKINEINEKLFRENLYAPDIPDPELMIRTSGEFRISNFLLWQLSYSEIYVTDVLWPDFNEEEFFKAVENFTQRERRFGGR